jgi:hypothetical protein
MPHTVAFKLPNLLLDLGQVARFQIEDEVFPIGSLRSVEDVERLCQRLGWVIQALNLCGHEMTWLLAAQQGPAPPATLFSLNPDELTGERSPGWPDAGVWFTGGDVVALRVEPRPLLSKRGAGYVNVAAVALGTTGLPANCRFVADPAVDGGVAGQTGGWLIAPVDDQVLSAAVVWLLGRLEAAVTAALAQLKTTLPGLTRAWLESLNGGGTPPPIGLLWALDPDLVPSLPGACKGSAKLIRDHVFTEIAGLRLRLYSLFQPTRSLLILGYAAIKRADGWSEAEAFKAANTQAILTQDVWQDAAFPAGTATGRRDKGHLYSLLALHGRGGVDLFASVELAAKFYKDWMGTFWKAFPNGTDLEVTGAINAAIAGIAEAEMMLKAAGYRNASRGTIAAIIACEGPWNPQARNYDTSCKTCKLLGQDRPHWDSAHPDRAAGLTQFIRSTWLDHNKNSRTALAQYTSSHGIVGIAEIAKLRFDVRLAVRSGVEYALYGGLSDSGYVAAVKRYFSVASVYDLTAEDLLRTIYYAHHEGPGAATHLLGLLGDGLASTARFDKKDFKKVWNNHLRGNVKALTDQGLVVTHFSKTDQEKYASIGAEIAAGTEEAGAQNAFFSDPERTQESDAARVRFNYAYAVYLKKYTEMGVPWLSRGDQFNPIPPKGP